MLQDTKKRSLEEDNPEKMKEAKEIETLFIYLKKLKNCCPVCEYDV